MLLLWNFGWYPAPSSSLHQETSTRLVSRPPTPCAGPANLAKVSNRALEAEGGTGLQALVGGSKQKGVSSGPGLIARQSNGRSSVAAEVPTHKSPVAPLGNRSLRLPA